MTEGEPARRTGRAFRARATRLLAELWSNQVVLSAVGVVAAGLILVEVNVAASRHFARWDVTAGRRFTLSAASRALLQRLEAPLEVIVLLPSEHPLLVELRHTLDAYRAESARLAVRYVDPDRQPAEFLALGRQYELAATPTDSGMSVAEAAVLVRQGGRRWFIRSAELLHMAQDGRREPRIELALSEAVAKVQERRAEVICFIAGHGEKSLDDGGAEGLAELRRRLQFSNLQAKRVPLDVPEPSRALEGCPSIALLGPTRPLPPEHEHALTSAASRGARMLLMLDPIVDSEGRLVASGLSQLTEAFGLSLPGGFVLERASEARLPQGIGETFLATPAPHPITLGLSSDEVRTDARVIVSASQPLALVGGSPAVALLTTSPSGVVLDRLGPELEAAPTAHAEPVLVAAASRLTMSSGQGEARLVLTGASNVADSRAFREPSWFGNRVFTEQAIAWLTERPGLVPVPERPALPAGLALTQDSLASLLRYVLLFMPLTAALVGTLVLLRRRRQEDLSRRVPLKGSSSGDGLEEQP